MKTDTKQQNSIGRGNTGLAIKAGFWYVASSFLFKSIAFITIPIFSRLLSKSDFGEFGNYANWQSTFLIITSLELYNSLSRAYYDYKNDYNKYISSVTVLTFVSTAIIYLVFLLGKKWLFDIVQIPPQFVHIMFLTLFCGACKALFLARERTMYRYKAVAMISVIDTVIPTLIAVVLVAISSDSARLSARVYGTYLPSSLIGLMCAIVLLKDGRSFRWEHCKYALKISLPLLVSYLTMNLMTSSNLFVSKNLGGAEISAEVNMAGGVIHILTILFQALSGALTTWLMDNLEQGKLAKIRKESLVYIAGMAVVSMGVILIAPEIISILGGAKYASAVLLIPGFIFAALVQGITTVFTIILTYDKNVTKTALYTAILAIVNVAAKVVLFPHYGVYCLPAINVVTSLGLFMINYILVVRAGYMESIDILKYVATIIAAFVIVLVSKILYVHTILRYVVICFVFVCAVLAVCVFWKKLSSLIKKKK